MFCPHLQVCTEIDLTRDLCYTFTHSLTCSLTQRISMEVVTEMFVDCQKAFIHLPPPLPQLSLVLIVLRAFTLWFLIIILTTHCSSDSNLITTFVCALPHHKVLQNTFSFSREAPPSPRHIYRQRNHSVVRVCHGHRDSFSEKAQWIMFVSSRIFLRFQQFLQTHCKMKQFCPQKSQKTVSEAAVAMSRG